MVDAIDIKQNIGAAAEELAARHLIAHGAKIVERNYRVRGGEIDLIVQDKDCLVFVEVRLRSNASFGGAGASITTSKQRRIILAAQHYLTAKSGREPNCRFDCILLDTLDAQSLEWIKGAFSLSLGLLAFCASLAAQQIRVLVQSSPLAGYQYHAGASVWEQLQAGDTLTLIREPNNPHDNNAVRVEWRGQQLGYLPRAENQGVAAELDRGTTVEARIARLKQAKNPWQRVLIDVYIKL